MQNKIIKHGFILEDHLPTMQWLESALSNSFPEIKNTRAESISQAELLLSDYHADIALIDLGLPDGSGLTILKLLQETSPQTLRIVTTTFSDDEHLFSALQAGAQGYILKEQDVDQIAQLLSAAVMGQPALSPQIARRILVHFQPESENEALTPRQTEVLQLIGKGYKNREVADLLKISTHTVHGYIKEIYQLLGISSRSEATLEATKRGLIR